MFSGKKILLGVTSGIAAYKVAELVRLFIKNGIEVKVVMTPNAKNFVSPLTLSILSKNPVYDSLFHQDGVIHVELGLWADMMIIAPTTSNTLAKIATGICDNMLMAVYLSAKCPVYIAPAMDLDMYQHSTTKNNLDTIKSFGNKVIPVGVGELASGLIGEGRMAEPSEILDFVVKDFENQNDFQNKKILITAGATYEAIDPVRFIGNHSSGKMGFEIAEQLAYRGAEVILITGKVDLKIDNPNIKRIDITSADEMYDATHQYFDSCDIAILSAAVGDYKPKFFNSQKIKKNETELYIELVKNKDILQSLGKIKKQQILVGFALETENEIENAKNKIHKKNLDFIVLNSLNDKGAGFGGDTNKITIINKSEKITTYPLKTKNEVAEDILKYLSQLLKR